MNERKSPETIGPYEVTGIIAEGGMATVYRGIQRSLDRPVAIKVLHLDLASDSDLIARFERESTTVAKLSHPNIIQVIDRGEADGHYYIVMEFVHGHGVDDLIRAGRIPIYQAVSIAIQVARAMQHAHDRGIIHRDIKPANVLVAAETGTVKVTDFGIAHLAEQHVSNHTLTQAQVSMGTVEYMSPEQRRDARAVDARSDIFSFGVLLYEMLAGHPPVGRFRDLHEIRDDAPPLLSKIVVRCLQEDRAERYASFMELLGDLQKLSDKEMVYREALAKAAHSVMKVPRKAKTAISRRTTRLFGLRRPTARLLALGASAVLLGVILLLALRPSPPGGRTTAAPLSPAVARDASPDDAMAGDAMAGGTAWGGATAGDAAAGGATPGATGEVTAETLYQEARRLEEEVAPPRGREQAHWLHTASLYRALLDEWPDSPRREDAWWRLSQLFVHKGAIRDFRKAVAILEQMAVEFPKSRHEPLFAAAEIARVDLADRTLARRLYQAFIQAQPESPGVRDARWRLERL